jgi:hypothetical protein
MAYSNTVDLPRPDISMFLEESHGEDASFIAQKVLPVVDQKAPHGRYPRIRRAKGGLMKLGSTKRAPDGSYVQTNRAFEWDTYDVQEYGSEERIDDRKAKEYENYFDIEALTAKFKMEEIVRDYESRVANIFQATGNGTDYGLDVQTTNAVVAYTESNLATVDFSRDIQEAQARGALLGMRFNTLVITLNQFNRLRRSTKLQNFLFSTLGTGNNKLITENDLIAPFRIKNIFIADAAYDASAAEADTLSASFFWGDNYMYLLNVQGGDFRSGGIGRTITWSADCPGGLFTSETYRDNAKRGDMVRVRSHMDEKLIDVAAIQRIATNWA